MNCVSSECESFCQSDLVFIMSGGAYNGTPLPIKTQKCILAFDGSSGGTQQSRCAIFRGDAGVTVRNLDSRVLVNGEVRPEHWLQLGDRIEFPNSVVLEVSQLGYTGNGAKLSSPPPGMEASVATGLEFNADEGDRNGLNFPFESGDAEFSPNIDQVSLDQTPGCGWTPNDKPEVASDVLSCVENRFHEIEERLNQLADQISSLVTLASCGKLSSTAMPESDWDKQINSFSDPQPSPPPAAILENEPAKTPAVDTFAPANRFNVADFGPAADSSKLDATLAETNPGNLPAGFADQLISANDGAALVPTRRMAEENISPVSSDETASIVTSPVPSQPSAAGLFELMESLAQGDSGSIQTASDLASAPQLPFDGASRFSPFGAIEPTSPTPTQAVAPVDSKKSVAKPTSVDEEIDAMLSRLFDGKTSAPPAPIVGQAQDQNHAIQDQFSSATDELAADPTPATSTNVDPHTSSAGTQTEISYSDMKFGYNLSKSEIDSVGGGGKEIPATAEAEPLTEKTSSQPTESISSDKVATENVMDLLARLKQDGCWDPSDNESQATHGDQCDDSDHVLKNHANENVHCSQSTNSESTSTETIASYSGAQVETPPSQPSGAADSVEDYMNQLLARMNVGLEAPDVPKSKEQKNAANAKLAQAALEDSKPNSELMTAEEYVPKQKAAKIESLETMREIANTTARSAVAFSDLDRRKARGLMQVFIGFGAFIMAAYYFLFVSKAFADTAFFVGSICLLITAGASYLAFNTFQGTGILNDLFPQSKRGKKKGSGAN